MDYSVERFVLTPFEENCYVLYTKGSSNALIIDSGDVTPELLDFLQSARLTPKFVILTHGHFDHMGGVARLKKLFGAAVVAIHALDAPMVGEPHVGGARLFGFDADPVTPDWLLADGDRVREGDINLVVLHTPGHTPGGITLYDENHRIAFCGDLIFRGAIGRYDLPGSDGVQLSRSILTKILALPDHVKLFPGHGPETTVGIERRTNPFVLEWLRHEPQ
jgi:glyoxylase-like metal-dependent hydrolase (beta-lactamase superfamily II)